MAKFFVLVLGRAKEDGLNDAFEDWYENTHLDEVLATTGWKRAQRFHAQIELGPAAPNQHLAWYEAEADSAEQVLEQLNSTRDQRQQSDTFDRRSAAMWIFGEAGPLHIANI